MGYFPKVPIRITEVSGVTSPDFNHGSGIVGFNDASDALNVTVGLLQRGYSVEDIEKIWGGNFLRVFREAERVSAQPHS